VADGYISGSEPTKKLQTYENTVSGQDVHSEAVTPTDATGVPYSASNPFPVTVPGTTFTDVLSTSTFNLLAGEYDQTYTFTAPAALSGVFFTFSTTEPRRVRIYRGAQLVYDVTSVDLMLVWQQAIGFPTGDTLRIRVGQTAAACTVTMKATVMAGNASLVGSTVTLGTSTAQIGQVKAGHIFPVRQTGALHTLRGERFITTTGYVQQTLNTSGELIAMMRNPSGSGKVILFAAAEFGATVNCRFSRFGGATPTLIGSPTPRPVGRADGTSSGNTPVAEVYTAGNSSPQFSTSGGTLRKVAAMVAYDTYQILGIDGTIVLQPGGVAHWQVDEVPGGGAGNFYSFIDFEWWEIDTATWAAKVAAALAQPLY
jgi:hypothetical protein